MNATLEHFDATWEPAFAPVQGSVNFPENRHYVVESMYVFAAVASFWQNGKACALHQRESDTSSSAFRFAKTFATGLVALLVRPRESPPSRGQARGPRAKHTDLSKTGPPLPWGRTESVGPHAFTNSLWRWSLKQHKMVSSPVRTLWARGAPSFRSSSVPRTSEGDGAPQGAWPGLRQTGPGARDSRASPDRRALGVKRHAPRLVARQRSILAFMPLTVAGPGRLLVAGEAARVPPGVEGCVFPRSRVPLPFPAFKTPHECAPRTWIGMRAA
jgi:hypothetical protein